ncbi:hypothetical protein [Litoribacillus peritrichatus]|uniref:LXG domain-containing protein n=1 Tax=Litoribacillus peritrichatus TaxID=718191 RepID=A0ABP7M840_9GAMM
MSEILLCKQSMSAQVLNKECGLNIDQLSTCNASRPSIVSAHTPYIIGNPSSSFGLNALSQLDISRRLTDLSLSFGGDNVMALSQVTSTLKDFNVGLIGATTSVYANRIGGFAGAVKDYQAALMEYHQAIKSNSALKTSAKQKAQSAFNKMQVKFRNELKVATAGIKSRRGTPLTNVNRGTNIARSSRNAAKLNVMNQVQANNLVKFTKHAKFLGNGLAVIDFSSRAGRVHNSYQAGGNWERELFIESTSFAASAVAGSALVSAGSAALGFLMVATPVGWVGLIVGGVIVAGTSAVGAMAVNSAVKDNSGDWYDSILKAIGV